MILIDNLTIPSGFQKLDSRVTDADQCANVRDIQRVVLNHNILASRRTRKNILSIDGKDGGSGVAPPKITWITSYLSHAPPVWLTGNVLINTLAQKMRIAVYADRTETVANVPEHPELAFFFMPQRAGVPITPNAYSHFSVIIVTAAPLSPSWFTVDVPLPYNQTTQPRIGGSNVWAFACYVLGRPDLDASLFAAAAVTDSGSNWVRTTQVLSLPHYGQLIEVDGADMPQSVVVGSVQYGASDIKYYVDPPWSRVLGITDTITARVVCGVRVHSMSWVDLSISAFDAVPGAL